MEIIKNPYENKCFLQFPLYCKSMHGCRSPGRASRDSLSHESMREKSLENQREMKVPLLRRHAIPGRARRRVRGARVPVIFKGKSSKNLVKSNVSSKTALLQIQRGPSRDPRCITYNPGPNKRHHSDSHPRHCAEHPQQIRQRVGLT